MWRPIQPLAFEGNNTTRPLRHRAAGRGENSAATNRSIHIRIRQKLPRRLLLRQTMQRAESPHQIYRMDANNSASRK